MKWWTLARAQSGVITRAQLLAHRVSDSAIKRMLGDQQLVAVAGGVYLVRGAPWSKRARLWAAVLVTDGVLGFATAAELWEQIAVRAADAPVHVVLPHSRRVDAPSWVRVYRLPLPRDQVVERAGLPVTSRAWTLCDYLPTLSAERSMQLADRALQQRWLTADDMARRLRGYPGRRGNPRLRELLALTADGAAAESERRLHRLLRRAGINGGRPTIPCGPAASSSPRSTSPCPSTASRSRSTAWHFISGPIGFSVTAPGRTI